MSDSFREVTRTSWFSRVARSFVGTLVGIVLVIASIVGLFWNEGRAVTTARSLAEGAGIAVSVGSDSVDPGNEGSLVHISGAVSTMSRPADGSFGISVDGLRLVRVAEMYQWHEERRSETETKLGGDQETVTTYNYTRDWSDRPIDSGSFKQPGGHANPPMEIRGQSFQVPEASLGAFRLDTPVLDRVGGEERLAVTPAQREAVEAAFGGTKPVGIVDGRIYLANDAVTPVVGDYRIGYRWVPLGPLSIIGRQAGDGLAPYQTQAGDALLIVDTGSLSADQMFEQAQASNVVVTWILRAVGLLVLTIGFALMLALFGVLADVIPFLGSLVRFGTTILALVLAVLVGAVTIAFAWFWYRPLLALAILGGGAVIAYLLTLAGRKKAQNQPAPSAPGGQGGFGRNPAA